ncbi:MAG: hypothetical protein L0271_22265 [Gemmatimonadetes bacterium]|nr:hypothetical protein [Gemmatimonadota bacterium]
MSCTIRMDCMLLMLGVSLAAQETALDNEYVRVTRNAAPCAAAGPACRDRVIVALGPVELQSGSVRRSMARGDIAVFGPGESYDPPSGMYFEVAIKPDHPPLASPAEYIPPEKNTVRYESDRLFIFEEQLAVGETRARHSHRPRVVIQLNPTRLQQWPDGAAELIRDIVPDQARFNPAVVHTVRNVGDLPLRGVVIELKARRFDVHPPGPRS